MPRAWNLTSPEKHLHFGVCVCFWASAWLCVYTWTSIHVRAYTLWTRWLLRTMKSNWHSLPLCGMRLLLWFCPTRFLEAASCLRCSNTFTSAKWECCYDRAGIMTLFYSWQKTAADEYLLEHHIFLMVRGGPWMFGGSYMISCHLRKSQNSWSSESRATEWQFV